MLTGAFGKSHLPAALLDRVCKSRDISVSLNTRVTDIRDGVVSAESCDKESEIPFDDVIVCIDIRPGTEESLAFFGITENTAVVGNLLRTKYETISVYPSEVYYMNRLSIDVSLHIFHHAIHDSLAALSGRPGNMWRNDTIFCFQQRIVSPDGL